MITNMILEVIPFVFTLLLGAFLILIGGKSQSTGDSSHRQALLRDTAMAQQRSDAEMARKLYEDELAAESIESAAERAANLDAKLRSDNALS